MAASSSSVEVVREAALYLEYFLKGLSECNVIGSYTVQFLELRTFSVRLQASLAGHLICLLINMKGLLMKLDSSLIPFSSVGVQTEEPMLYSLCNCQRSSSCLSPKRDTSQDSKACFEGMVAEKSYEPTEIAQLLDDTPLIPLKQEMPCIDTSHLSSKDTDTSVIRIGSPAAKEPDNLEESTATGIKSEKCNVALSFQTSLDDGLNIEYAATSHLEEEQPEILLDHVERPGSAQAEGLMYSIYTMSSCGSLELVSRVLSKNKALKESSNELVEKAMIEINHLKEELGSQDPLESMTLQGECDQDQESTMNQEEETIALIPDTPLHQDKSYKNASTRRQKSSKQKKTVEEIGACGSMFNEIYKLGPEDIGNATWCEVCEKEFPSVGSLKAHVSRTHRKVKWCNTCNKTIGSGDMKTHVLEYHSDLPHVCDVCGQSLSTNRAFQRHMDIHKGLRGSACEVCGQTFSRTEYYRDHIRIHTGEKPFKCETCKKAFARSSNLYAHMRIHNGEEERHMCKLCLKSFARADKLKEHAIRHLQVKRYACRLCPKSYREKRDLVKHLNKIHSNEQNCDPE